MLARHLVDTLRPPLVALTGSQGKTGTKDYLAHVLAGSGPTVATAGNHNNEIGVPLTVLETTADTRFLVVEMGARGIGHIAYLCRIAPPTVAAVVNVGTAHIGEFGSREAIGVAKGEIVEALPADGVAVLNADDDVTVAHGLPDRRPGADLRRRGRRDLARARARRPGPPQLRARVRRRVASPSGSPSPAPTRCPTPPRPPPWRSRSGSTPPRWPGG